MRQLWRRASMHPVLRPSTEWRVHRKWMRAGRPIPAPPVVKQRVVKQALRRHSLDTVIETGTFTGEMVAALLGHARRIVSIELDDALYAAAARRFAQAPGVELLHGDSARLLAPVVNELSRPALFWLDGHYTGPGSARTDVASPIVREIETILAHPVSGHVVLIDDAREFTGQDGYPTIDALKDMVRRVQPRAEFAVEDDIIRWVSKP
jgi:hypothetical protein